MIKKYITRFWAFLFLFSWAYGQTVADSSSADKFLRDISYSYIQSLFHFIALIFNSIHTIFSLYIYPFLQRIFHFLNDLSKEFINLLGNLSTALFAVYNNLVNDITLLYYSQPSDSLITFLKVIPILVLLGLIISPLNLATKPLFLHSIREIKFYTGRVGKRFVILSTVFLTLAILATGADGALFYFLLKTFSEEGGGNLVVMLLSVVIPLIMALIVDATLVQVGGIYLKSFFYFLFHMHDEWEEFLHRIQMAKYRKFSITPFTHIVRITQEINKTNQLHKQERDKRYSLVNWLGILFSISVGVGLFFLMLIFLFAWGSARDSNEDIVYILIGKENYFFALILSILIIFSSIFAIELIRSGKLRRIIDNSIPERFNFLKIIGGFLLILSLSLIIIVLIKWLPDFLNYVVDGIFKFAPIKGISYSVIEGALFYITIFLLSIASIIFTYILYRSHSLFETFNEKFFSILTSLFFILVVLGAFLVNTTRGDFMEYARIENEIKKLNEKIEKIETRGKAATFMVYKDGTFDYEATLKKIEQAKKDTVLYSEYSEEDISDALELAALQHEKQGYEQRLQQLYKKTSVPFSLGLAFIISSLAYVAGVTFYLAVHILGGGLAFYILTFLGIMRMFTFLAALPAALISIGPILVALISIALMSVFLELFYGVLVLRKVLADKLAAYREDRYKEGFIDGMYLYLEEGQKDEIK